MWDRRTPEIKDEAVACSLPDTLLLSVSSLRLS